MTSDLPIQLQLFPFQSLNPSTIGRQYGQRLRQAYTGLQSGMAPAASSHYPTLVRSGLNPYLPSGYHGLGGYNILNGMAAAGLNPAALAGLNMNGMAGLGGMAGMPGLSAAALSRMNGLNTLHGLWGMQSGLNGISGLGGMTGLSPAARSLYHVSPATRHAMYQAISPAVRNVMVQALLGR